MEDYGISTFDFSDTFAWIWKFWNRFAFNIPFFYINNIAEMKLTVNLQLFYQVNNTS